MQYTRGMSFLTPIDPATLELEELEVRGPGSSPARSFEINQSLSTRRFQVPSSKFRDALIFFLGDQELFSSGTHLARRLPQVDPEFADLIAVKVTNIVGFNWKGTDIGPGDVLVNRYDKTRFDVIYQHCGFAIAADDDIESEIDRYVERPSVTNGSGSAISPPGNVFKFVNLAGVVQGLVPAGIPVVSPSSEFTVTWRRLPEAAWEADAAGVRPPLFKRIYVGIADDGSGHGGNALPFFGTVSSEDLLGYPAGTLLLSSVNAHRNKSPLGDRYEIDLEFGFSYLPRGWLNLLFYPDGKFYYAGRTAAYYNATDVPDFHGLYNARPHSLLFQVY